MHVVDEIRGGLCVLEPSCCYLSTKKKKKEKTIVNKVAFFAKLAAVFFFFLILFAETNPSAFDQETRPVEMDT